MCPNPQFPIDLVKFTEEIINGKLHFLCGGEIIFPSPAIYILFLFKTLHYVFKSDSVKISSQKAWLHRLYATPGFSLMQINPKIIIEILFILPFSLKMPYHDFSFLNIDVIRSITNANANGIS